MLNPDMTLGQITEQVAASKRNLFPVVDEEHELLGVIVLEDLREVMFKTEMHEEMEIHRKLVHPNIVRWLSNVEHQGRLATVMEYCENGTLEDLLKLQVSYS